MILSFYMSLVLKVFLFCSNYVHCVESGKLSTHGATFGLLTV